MKKIIQFALHQTDQVCSYTDIETHLHISKQQVQHIFKECKYVRLHPNYMKYEPPLGICNKQTLKSAIQNAFPQGIPWKVLEYSYEFAQSDVNNLLFENAVFVYKYGKREEKILFAPPPQSEETSIDLRKLWNSVANDITKPVPILFKKC